MSSAEQALATGAQHLLAGKYFQVAAFVMLLYDHALTISDEVERVWKKRISGGSLLFLLNRYVTPLQFIIIIDAFNDPRWPKSVCSRFVVFEGASTVVLVAICQLIMILRVYALYHRSSVILGVLMTLWTAQITVSAIGLHTGITVPLPPQLVGCILTGDGPIFPCIWVAPLVTDTCIFGLTIWRTHRYIRDSGKAPTLYLFVRDGSAYFAAIFMANFLNTMMYFLATEDLKAIGASFSQLITALMVSRLYLNLRQNHSEFSELPYDEETIDGVELRVRSRRNRGQSFLTQTIADLAEDLDSGYYPDRDDKNSGDDKGTIVIMSSMSLRRKLDHIPNNV
ncbi:hypothetical protein BDN70DRAFT_883128 [Pholiota conissans]|uniref:DUF6533 domain-containing protein n=1 Tax=Pholiota conissans TaxID=109636 RepID=A0A9P6CWR6_9AGAR|nr:hypothetical protein BDN70DRAFT_883128 [Pholiota conissans]